ncbi:SCO6745 family protein [Nocardioides sp. Soil774]|uniref:SCO6745 family protein n=1 Tax=Nocardioides sp. Soil774 TaxID=1736408 RepID=UPI000A5803A0|nr:MarR family transcriptional regulator [Nocardioides sp. Soil774]
MTTSDTEGPVARLMFELTEPISLASFFADEPNDAMAALGLRTYWDGYFAGRAAPLGAVPPEVVDAAFYSFAPGEVARHVPQVWATVTPDAAHAARQRGCGAALVRILADLATTPDLARAADLLARAASGASLEGRVMYAALRALPVPEAPVERLWHAANMLREHRGDGHVVALMAAGIDRTECHVLFALGQGIHPAETFGRIHHLPQPYLAAVMARLRERGIVDATGHLTDAGREVRSDIEAMTDTLAEAPYAALEPAELDELVALLEPIARRLGEAGSR